MTLQQNLRNLTSNPKILGLVVAVIFGIAGLSYLLLTQAASAGGPIVGVGNKCLDNYANLKRDGNKIHLWTCNKTDAQVWTVNSTSRNIVNANGLCLTAESKAERALVKLNKCTTSDLQKWVVNSLNNTIVSAASGLCLDSYAALTRDGNKIWMYKCNGTVAQVWKPQSNVVKAPSILTFTATPISVTTGKASTLNWSTENATTCSVTPGGPTNTMATSWTTPAIATAGTKTYTLACKNTVGAEVTKTVSVRVTAPVTVTPSSTRFDIGLAYGSNTDPAPLESLWGAKVETRRTYYGAADQTKAVNVVKANIAAGRKTSAISFKLPFSWAEMAAGKGDTWAKSLSDALIAANPGGGHNIRIAFHHEPENDTGTNNGASVAGRDAWKNMQARLSTFYDRPGFQYTAILMGYHTFYGSATMKSLWNLDASIPTNAKVKAVGFDVYQGYGVGDNGTRWTDMNAYFIKMGTWAKAHNMAWGLSETGVSASAFAARPTYFTDTIAQMKAQGGSWIEYFNTDLNSPDPKWSFKAGEAREKAYGAALRAERAN